MAAYRWVDGLVTCGLTTCTPGSTPDPMLGNEYAWENFTCTFFYTDEVPDPKGCNPAV